MECWSRRDLLRAGAGAALGVPRGAEARPRDRFTFVHLTDPHVQPELRADEGFRACLARIAELKPAFALAGGDLVMDVFAQSRGRAERLARLYQDLVRDVDFPLHAAIGNHDCFAVAGDHRLSPGHRDYGKQFYLERFGQGRRYYSFDHGRWHFISLDSIGLTDGGYIGLVDEEQLDWLRRDLEATGRRRPVVVMTHIPLLTLWGPVTEATTKATGPSDVVTNGRQVSQLLEQYNVKLVLQGHQHIREEMVYHGIRYITGGAVCGNWWQGSYHGHPPGFGVCTVRGDAVEYRFETYGWKA